MSSSLPTKKIGGASVSAIGYGAMGIGLNVYGAPDTDEERFKVLDRLVELGCTHWDTSSAYGDSEELIGKWFARTGKRSGIFLATKFGLTYNDDKLTVRGDREYVLETIETSLKRLQTDHIDLLYQHRADPVTPIEITVGAMKEAVEAGKVKYLGLSEAHPDTMRRAQAVHPVSALQVEYSPWELELEQPGGVIEVARELGITIIAYSPTGRGLLSGRWHSFDDLPEGDWRRGVPKFAPKNWPRINSLIDAFSRIGKKYNATPAQVAIAWLLRQGPDVIPIPGSRQIKYVEENVAAAEVAEKLDDEDVKEIRTLAESVGKDLSGEARYPDMSHVYTKTPPLEGWKPSSRTGLASTGTIGKD